MTFHDETEEAEMAHQSMPKTGIARQKNSLCRANWIYKFEQTVICMFVLLVILLSVQKIIGENPSRLVTYGFFSFAAICLCVLLSVLPWPKHTGCILFAAALLLRCVMIVCYPIAPASDFKLQLDLAMQFSYQNPSTWPQMMAETNNMFYQNWCVHAPFLLLEMLILKVFGHSVTALQLIFAICSAASCAVSYHIGNALFRKRAGVIAGLLMVIQPTWLFFMPVLSNQHTATFFFLLAIYVVIAQPIGKSEKTRLSFWQRTSCNAMLSGVCASVSQLLRPEMSVLHLVLLLFWLIYLPAAEKSPNCRIWSAIKQGAVRLILYLCAFFIIVGSVDFALQSTNFIDGSIREGNLTYKIMVGLNAEMGGIWNIPDSEVTDTEAMKQLIQQRLSDPKKVAKLVIHKLAVQFGTYNYGWAIGDKRGPLTDQFFPGITQCFMLLVLLLSASCTIKLLLHSTVEQTFLLIVLCGFFATFAVIEIQDRYNYLLIPLIVILSAKTLDRAYLRIKSILLNKTAKKLSP